MSNFKEYLEMAKKGINKRTKMGSVTVGDFTLRDEAIKKIKKEDNVDWGLLKDMYMIQKSRHQSAVPYSAWHVEKDLEAFNKAFAKSPGYEVFKKGLENSIKSLKKNPPAYSDDWFALQKQKKL